ncbi:hypothetical protein P7K49_034205 [Saguinus oedipus]|uniref:Uncharacterized protein n=1 Tax=Saguinus oedipus TaxID=9490 RepID=A0ABQ9TV67_SAGOE|nr:hypothetical protein P7K49_034205 [Saguinus oedipus]
MPEDLDWEVNSQPKLSHPAASPSPDPAPECGSLWREPWVVRSPAFHCTSKRPLGTHTNPDPPFGARAAAALLTSRTPVALAAGRAAPYRVSGYIFLNPPQTHSLYLALGGHLLLPGPVCSVLGGCSGAAEHSGLFFTGGGDHGVVPAADGPPPLDYISQGAPQPKKAGPRELAGGTQRAGTSLAVELTVLGRTR